MTEVEEKLKYSKQKPPDIAYQRNYGENAHGRTYDNEHELAVINDRSRNDPGSRRQVHHNGDTRVETHDTSYPSRQYGDHENWRGHH